MKGYTADATVRTGLALTGMTLAVWFSTAAGLTAAVAAPPAPKAKAEPAKITWQPDLPTAHRVATATGKPVLVVFGAEWCTFCKKYDERTLGNPTMAGVINREFVPVHLDYDKDRAVAEALEVQSLPCTVLLSPEADLLGRVVGAKEPKVLWEALQDAKEAHAKVRQTRLASAAR